ncbi:precorrin-3B synthase [Shimia gijangensis]|uniref:Precorrin-3B synthase n=1 Tax=Shimia gijangensis TaxID=1470563 RepID=A0A1M6LMR6_9RHOB|nr:precorrin-3B synthase [Shimia gijangensis]SHJ72430.1 precorrin-3B synthase [Shimia gijangensis]
MTRPDPKGWCPGAYRPMMSGDGLVVRVRPMLARLTTEQINGLCDLADRYGSGLIDLTSRANLQIRGVKEHDHEALLQALAELQLLENDPDLEGRRNILMTPLWQAGDDSHVIAQDLMARLADLPPLPAKMGFAIDAGPAPMLQNNSADFRIERDADGHLVLRGDGSANGRPVTRANAVDAILEMAHWFVSTGGNANRRMAAHLDKVTLPADWSNTPPARGRETLRPGANDLGAVYGVGFGQIKARAMRAILAQTKAEAIRVTPWRLFLLEGTKAVEGDDFITDATDPLLQVNACPGAPYCTAASVNTRALARELAGRIDGPLHISGCAKGCASPRKCRTTLVGRGGKFDLVRNGMPWDEPLLTDLSPDTLIDRIGDD